MRLFTQFQFKIRETKLQKSAKLCYFTDLFTVVQIRYWKTFKFGLFHVILNWRNKTQFIQQICVFLKKTTVYNVSGDTSAHP